MKWFFALVLVFALEAQAKRYQAPLMPERYPDDVNEEMSFELEKLEERDKPSTKRITENSSENVSTLGLELGAMGSTQYTIHPFLGQKWLLGGRVFYKTSISDEFSFIPSAGFFFNRDTAGYMQVWERTWEIGATFTYDLVIAKQNYLRIGPSIYAQGNEGTVYLGPVTQNLSWIWDVRTVGTAILDIQLTPGVYFSSRVELGALWRYPTRFNSYFGVGVGFDL